MTSSEKRLTLIELNEFSVSLLERGAREIALPNISRVLALPATSTTTDDLIEHRGLDPWVQWVSVHTGVPSTVHKIIHLGDTPSGLEAKQLWETLSEHGISSGVWGAMNATRGSARLCSFFLPDPWTFSEEAYPASLNGLLALPRYYSKNYLDVSAFTFLKKTIRLGAFLLGSGAVARIVRQAPLVLGGLRSAGLNNAVLFSLFDLFSAAVFSKYKEKYQPQLSIIFLNSIAHLQHHRWEQGERLSADLEFGLRVIDRVLGMLFESLAVDEAVVVMNALTQRNIVGEKPRICYRQINPERFLRSVGVEFVSVEQLMTNDAHVFFASSEDRDRAADAISRVKIEGAPLFQVEADASDSRKLFYQVDFWGELDGDVELEVNGRAVQFLENFEAIVARTGAHIREGNILSRGIELPDHMYNHEVAESLIAYFVPEGAAVARFAA